MTRNRVKSKQKIHWRFYAVPSFFACCLFLIHCFANQKDQNEIDDFKIKTLPPYTRDQFHVQLVSINRKSGIEDSLSLYDAVEKNNIALVRNLLNAGADPESVMSSQKENLIPPLLEAVYQNNEQMALLLLRHRANPNRKAIEGDRPLCATRSIKIAKLLLEYGADIHLQGFHHKVGSYTPLYASVFQASNGADVLMQHKIASYLFEKGGNLNARVGREGWTVLMEEAGNGAPEYIDEWIKRGANVNQYTKSGFSSLMFAAEGGMNENMEILLLHGAKINHLTNHKLSALMLAAEHGDPGTIKLLLRWGANIELKDSNRKTALDHALAEDNPAVAKLLLKEGKKRKQHPTKISFENLSD